MRAYLPLTYLTLAVIISIAVKANAAETPSTAAPISGAQPAAPDSSISSFGARMEFSRLVRDMTIWDFGSILQNPNWVVAQVTPTKQEEQLLANSHGIRPEVHEGTVTVVTPLDKSPQKAVWPYHYVRKAGEFNSTFNPPSSEFAEHYSPFRDWPMNLQQRKFVLMALPQSILYLETPNDASKVNWTSCRPVLINEELLPYVVPAKEFYLTNRELFAYENAAANKSTLLGLLDSPNPFLFAAATRTLSQGGQMDGDFIKQRLLKLDKLRQGVLVCSTLFYSPMESAKVTVDKMLKAIAEANQSSQLDGLNIGVNCAYVTYNERSEWGTGRPPSKNGGETQALSLYRPLLQKLHSQPYTFGFLSETK